MGRARVGQRHGFPVPPLFREPDRVPVGSPSAQQHAGWIDTPPLQRHFWGSSRFWENGVRPGSRYYWDNGREPGSRYYWENGRGCLSRYGWANTTACSSGETVVFQVLCIARKIDVAPCRAVNARLDDWLSRSDFYGSGHSADVVARMRQSNG